MNDDGGSAVWREQSIKHVVTQEEEEKRRNMTGLGEGGVEIKRGLIKRCW